MHHREPPRRKRGGGLSGLLAAVALFAMGAMTQPLWRDLLPGGSPALAARTADIPPLIVDAPMAEIAAFDAPRSYLVLPAGGSLTVPLRSGPSDRFDQVALLKLHDAVTGSGTSRAKPEWAWVTRASDGQAGYVHQSALLRRTASGVAPPIVATVTDETDGAAGRQMIQARYRRLLAKATGYDRTFLTDGQKLWEAQRRRCVDAPDPAACRDRLDARRTADLDDWRDSGRR